MLINVYECRWQTRKYQRILIFTKKKIPKGTEITYDYQAPWNYDDINLCLCLSKRCKGVTDATFTQADLRRQKKEIREKIQHHLNKIKHMVNI